VLNRCVDGGTTRKNNEQGYELQECHRVVITLTVSVRGAQGAGLRDQNFGSARVNSSAQSIRSMREPPRISPC
jgi:hypothetical protein